MSTEAELGASENPKKWRFSWESQSQVPILKLNLFNPNIRPSGRCIDLKVSLFLEQSIIKVSWVDAELEVSLKVPMPRVLVDFESPVHFKALDDHIEVKVSLLFSIDNPLVSTLNSVINLSLEEDESSLSSSLDELKPLLMDYDIECLSSTGGVYFYCGNCFTKLTTSLRVFEEMPSVNWREVADNWFGNCCCSFGGVSEKLVTSYAKSYTSTTGVCLLNTTSVILSKDDLVGFHIPDKSQKEDNRLDLAFENCVNNSSGSKDERIVSFQGKTKRSVDIDEKLETNCSLEDKNIIDREHKAINSDSLSLVSLTLEDVKNVALPPRTCIQDHDTSCCGVRVSEPSALQQESNVYELLENQKSFLNGFLGNIFMTRTSNLSKDVQWAELSCPCCSCLLGAYPSGSGDAPLDSGVHLFKCYISTCSNVGTLRNIFRRYTLEKMFTNQLLESAKDELSFRTLVRDLQTKRPMLQITLLNPNSWFCFGYCSSTVEQVPRVNMYPAIKLLFSDCRKSDECQLRMIEEWVTKNQADEVYMLASQTNELIGSLEFVKDILPPSHTLLQGFSLSSLRI